MPRQEYPSLRQGLVGAWCPSLGASGRLLIDRSGRNNHGTISGTGYLWGRNLSITGASTFATTSYRQETDFERTSSFSVSAWIFATTLAERTIFTTSPNVDGAGWEFQINNVGFLRFRLTAIAGTNLLRASTNGSFTLASGTFYHVAATYSGTSSTAGVGLFVNGAKYATTGDIDSLTSSTVSGSALRFFNRSDNSAPWSGTVDDLRIYSRVLTPSEIRLLASRPGIGLQPLPDRAAGLPRKLSVNVGGTWRAGDAYVNTGSGWRLGIPYVNVGGTFR